MQHPIYKVISVKIIAPYTLKLQFDDQSIRVINFEPVLHGEMYGPLRDITLFNQVKIDPEIKTIVWQNGADFDPAILHDWDEYVDELTARAESWEVA
ncbi:MAG: DUF2442 domain-containing protein [Bacteroidetes bacterium]|nr:MAG: DUF2442 domain-containing protein [Bacteroidota bacterium]